MNKRYQDIKIPTGYDIYWEKWVDPYADNNDSEGEVEENVLDEEDGDFGFEEEYATYSKPIKTVLTPFGALPLSEHSLASSNFKFWVGHTNFKISKKLLKLIANCRGVEAIDVLSPYRFRIAVGALFRDREVMYDVKKLLIRALDNDSKIP